MYTMPLSVRVEAGVPCSAHRGAELVDDDAATDTGVRGETQHVAGAVVDPGEDLDFGAIREPEVGEV